MLDFALLRPLAMLALPLLLALLPFRAGYRTLVILAFVLWAMGGLILTRRGLGFIALSDVSTMTLLLGLAGALLIGFIKGKLVLGKSSLRNVERLQGLAMPQKLIAVYPLRSWVLIMIMVGISLSLSAFGLDAFWRGLINIGIGMALMASSLIYLRYLTPPEPILPLDAPNDSSHGAV